MVQQNDEIFEVRTSDTTEIKKIGEYNEPIIFDEQENATITAFLPKPNPIGECKKSTVVEEDEKLEIKEIIKDSMKDILNPNTDDTKLALECDSGWKFAALTLFKVCALVTKWQLIINGTAIVMAVLALIDTKIFV